MDLVAESGDISETDHSQYQLLLTLCDHAAHGVP